MPTRTTSLAKHRCFGGVWLTHGSSGWELGPLVGAQQSTSQKQTATRVALRAALGTQDFHPDIIVDWGGSSYKVFIDGKRIGTEVTLSFSFFWGGKKYEKVLRKGVIFFAGDGCQFISLRGWHLA